MTTVTCIITAHDYESYVGLALRSVLEQDYPPELLDVVVVDDGSTDATAAVVEAIADEHPGRVTLIRQENRGLVGATNTALAAACGELVAICDADDLWLLGSLRRRVNAMRPGVGLVYGDMEVIDADGAITHPSFFAKAGIAPRRGHVLEALLRENFTANSTLLWRADLVRPTLPIPAACPYADHWIAVQAAARAEAEVVAAPCAGYRQHADNMSGVGGGSEGAVVNALRELAMLRELLASLGPSESAARHLDGRAGAALALAEERIAAGDLAGGRELAETVLSAVSRADLRAEALNDLGVTAFLHGDRGAARTHFHAAVETDPTHAVARENLVHVGATRRVLVCVEYFHPSVGGSERLAEDVGLLLGEAGWEVEIATRALPARTEDVHHGMVVHELEGDHGAELDALLVVRSPDAVLSFAGPTSWPILGALRQAERGSRVVVVPCVNEDGYRAVQANAGFRARLADALRRASAVGFSSHAGWDARLYRELDVPAVYLPNGSHGVDPDGSFRDRHDRPLLLCVGNFWPEKNHAALLTTLAQVPGDWQLALIGGPSSAVPEVGAEIERLATRDERVTLFGPAERPVVAAAMAEADVLLLPSLAEATPLVLVEAMSHGLPWIATPTCGSAHDHAGGLIRTLADFPETIAQLLGDAAGRASLGAAGRAHWEAAYSWDVVGPRYVALLEGGPLPALPTPDVLRATAVPA
jgi:glycosyltransferase involved in cell wall biosynthesis